MKGLRLINIKWDFLLKLIVTLEREDLREGIKTSHSLNSLCVSNIFTLEREDLREGIKTH